jgi:hypothetical protein
MDAEAVEFALDTVLIGAANTFDLAVKQGDLTKEEAKVGMQRACDILRSMLKPSWQDVFDNHIKTLSSGPKDKPEENPKDQLKPLV